MATVTGCEAGVSVIAAAATPGAASGSTTREPWCRGLTGSGCQLVHRPVDAFLGHRVGGSERLGEEADAQLLDRPADALQRLRVPARRQLVHELLVGLLHLLDAQHPVLVAARVAGELLEPALRGTQVAQHV